MSKQPLTGPVADERETPNGALRLAPVDEKEFRELTDLWHRETDYHSSFSIKLDHPAYKKIIAMGKPALPLILRELRGQGGWWFKALRLIANENPAPKGANYDGCKEAWLAWGKEKGLID